MEIKETLLVLSQSQTFPCPNCNEIISDAADTCRFCSAPIDREAAAAAAHTQSKVNRACSDASYLRTAAVLMWIFLGLSFIPFLPLVEWGFLFTFVAILVMLIRWQMKFSRIETIDRDYQQAKNSKNLALMLWLVALVVGFIVRPLVLTFLLR